ncbi:MAG: DNA-3-methyladenine glycosylase [Verrucomicrobia bacterium]|nr:DNA-3-methyladenine glycosylase [Verrucomicrobiota bacterium]
MWTPLHQSFFHPSAQTVAPLLLGHYLLRNTTDGIAGGPIVETEAYLSNDPACHSYGGETVRNRVMWGAPGRAYVYLIYGYHFCVNAVCRPPGIAEAVLIRAIEPTFGGEWMVKNRPVKDIHQLCSGPAKLCEALVIDRKLDGADLCLADSSIVVARNPERDQFCERRGSVVTTTRIGLTKAAELHLRFYLAGSPHVSRRAKRSAASSLS